jgi:hypothetical protein
MDLDAYRRTADSFTTELMREYYRHYEWPSETFLADVDEGFYCACYLRAWALETHLRSYLRERFGPAWFESREAGEVLRGLRREGQRLDAEELLGLTGEQLDFNVVLADLGLA